MVTGSGDSFRNSRNEAKVACKTCIKERVRECSIASSSSSRSILGISSVRYGTKRER